MNIAYAGAFLREGLLATGNRLYDLDFSGGETLGALLDKAPLPIDLVFCEFFGGRSDTRLFAASDYPVAGYFIDAPLNEFWIRDAAKNLDYAFVDQLQSAETLSQYGVDAFWTPLPVQNNYFQPPREKKYDLVFVGAQDRERIKRSNLLKLIKSRFPIKIMSGLSIPETQKIFSESKIVLNENFFPGLTLRVLQGLSAGSIVFTENSPYNHDFGLKSGEDLMLYGSANILDLIAEVLGDYGRYSRIASAGRRKCSELYSAEKIARDVLISIGTPKKRTSMTEEDAKWHRLRSSALFAFRFGGNLGPITRELWELSRQDSPRAVDALTLVGDIQARLKHGDDALKSYLKASEMDPASLSILKRALLAIARDDAKGAVELVRAWIEGNPGKMDCPRGDFSLEAPTTDVALLLVAEIYHSLGKIWDMGFAKSFVDPVPDSAFELARAGWSRRPSMDALDMMTRCLKPYHMERETLPFLLRALNQGILPRNRILETARVAYDYYDRETAETIMRSIK